MTSLRSLHAVLASIFMSVMIMPTYGAPLVDVYLSAGQWQADVGGEIGQNDQIATMSELGFDDEAHNVVSVVIDHSVPFIPNVKFRHTTIDIDANGRLERSLTFDDVTFSVNEDTETMLDLTHTDFTLFYSPLDNWVHLDIGLTGRKFSGDVSITGSTTGTESESLDEWLPMIYVGARFDLPLSGLYVGADVNGIGYDGNTLSDFSAVAGYQWGNLAVDVFAELGYRRFALEIDDLNDIEADLELDGVFFNLGVQF